MKSTMSFLMLTLLISIIGCSSSAPHQPDSAQLSSTPQPQLTLIPHRQPTPSPSALIAGIVAKEPNNHVRGEKVSQLDIVASTYKIRVGEQVGTSFLMEYNSRRYLITAKHIGIGITDSVYLDWQDGWASLPVQVVGHSDDDTTVLRVEHDLARAFILPEWTPPVVRTDLVLGEDVRFYGFPLGMSTSRGPSTVPVPLVKSGIISGFYGTEKLGEDSSFWIDGHNNRGFSGGPVVSIRNGEYAIAGVISAYRHSEEPVFGLDEQKSEIGTIRVNSGIIKAENISSAMQIIMTDK